MTEINDKTRESVIDGLHELLKHLRAERERLDAKIKQVESDLTALGDKSGLANTRKRRAWGENRLLVEASLRANPTKTFSVAALAEDAGIARSSVRSALIKIKADGHAEEVSDGIWKLK